MKAEDMDLRSLLRFHPEQGLLNLGKQRNLLFSHQAIAKLHGLLRNQLGNQLADSLLMRFGFQNGFDDFQTLSELFDWNSDEERLAAGPKMHSWSGIVSVEPELQEFDLESGHFYFKGKWHNSYEAELYRDTYGTSDHPVCFSLTGYGSGWCTAFFGKPLLEIETGCVAMGHEYCSWEIRPEDSWGPEAARWRNALHSDSASIHQSLEMQTDALIAMNRNLENQIHSRTKQLQQLLHLLCHDLEVPMNTAQRKLSQQKDNLDQDLTEAIHSIGETLRYARRTQLNRFETTVDTRTVSLHDLCRRAIMLTSHQARLKNTEIQFNPNAANDTIKTDGPILCNQILVNLLTNSVKFSPQGSRVSVQTNCHNETVTLEIKDQGIGIPKATRNLMHASYNLPHKPGTAKEPGYGYGLSLALAHANLLGIKVDVTSTTVLENPLEHGTSFLLTFPNDS